MAVQEEREVEVDDLDDMVEGSTWTGSRFLRDHPDDDPNWDGFDFQWQFETDARADAGRQSLWIYADEHGDPHHAAWLIRTFLKELRRDQCWSLTWAATCAQPRAGQFRGGAVFVTADAIRCQVADAFVQQQRAAVRPQPLLQQACRHDGATTVPNP